MKLPFEGCVLKEYPAGSITQYFGENPSLYARMGMKGHNGVDLVAPHGTLMVAIEAGTIIDVRLQEDGYGRHLRLLGKAKDGVCNEWTYGHCDEICVEVGMTVKEGEPVASMGNTGFVISGQTPFWAFNPHAGTHDHMGLRKVKRSVKGWSYPGSTIKIEVLNYGNGYKGAIDPLPYFKINTTPDVENLKTQVSLLSRVVELLKQLKALK